jgi:hypothetical protein
MNSGVGLVVVRRSLGETAFCCACGRRPDTIEVERGPTGGFVVAYYCHGRCDWAKFEERELASPAALRFLLNRISRCFPRSIARHGQLGQAGRLMRAAQHGARR